MLVAHRIPSALSARFGRRVTLSLVSVIAFVVINLLLVATCMFALRQNTNLQAQTARLAALLTPPNGTVVPALDGTDWKGAKQAIDYDHDPRPTLVYTFSKGCSFCQHNWPAMRSLQGLAPRRLRIAYIDDNGDKFTPEYLVGNGIGESALLIHLSPVAAAFYNARVVPQLLLVDSHGRVEWSHLGELTRADISKALSLIEHDYDEGRVKDLSVKRE